MEAQELRIRNYFLDRGGKLIQLHYWESAGKIAQNMVVGGMTVHPMTENVEYLMPIPLTEEWLLKFGFEWKIQHQGFHNGAFKIEEEYKKGYRFYIGNEKISIQYVHQLQNLYHALTGKELEIK